MQLNPHLTFGGQCEAAFTFYEKCLGGTIVLLMMYGDSPLAKQPPLAGAGRSSTLSSPWATTD